MPVISTGRKYYSQVVKHVGSYGVESGSDMNFAVGAVTGSGDVDNYGLCVIWDNATTSFVAYTGQDIAAAKTTGSSPLAGNRVIAVVIGDGLNQNESDTTLSGTPTNMNLLFNGEATVILEGLFRQDTNAIGDAFIEELEANRIVVQSLAEVVTPTYHQA